MFETLLCKKKTLVPFQEGLMVCERSAHRWCKQDECKGHTQSGLDVLRDRYKSNLEGALDVLSGTLTRTIVSVVSVPNIATLFEAEASATGAQMPFVLFCSQYMPKGLHDMCFDND
ncbi:unnamed protein product [Toxocara canis]|uniref:Helitron_like_N domain-containing protein n=1 Tax=Toxocara canis TaxID=6265 RepID=A0A183U6U5_TOXCA|nr:unnamed protein product [Toxocara canis]